MKLNWSPLALAADLSTTVQVYNGMAVFLDQVGVPQVYEDGCPHGASLEGAPLLLGGRIACPHNLEFDARLGLLRDGTDVVEGGEKLNKMWTEADHGLVWVDYDNGGDIPRPPTYPTEAFLSDFATVRGASRLECDAEAIVENFLDYIHASFRSDLEETPYLFEAYKLDAYRGRATYVYRSNALPTRLSPEVKMVCEWELPTTFQVRAEAAGRVKVIRGHVRDDGPGECTLFWSLHRNFLTSPIFDHIVTHFVKKTLREDVMAHEEGVGESQSRLKLLRRRALKYVDIAI